MPKHLLYLDDLQVGDNFISGEHVLVKEEIISFANQYDPQLFHTDEEAAKDTFFKGLAGSGWNTAAITMRLIIESVPFSAGIIGAGVDVTWPNPTRPGDILHVESKITDIKISESKPSQGIIFTESRTLNQKGEVRQITRAKLLNFFKA